MRDESLKLIMEHVGGDLIPDNASANDAVGKVLLSHREQSPDIKLRINNVVLHDDHCCL